MMKIKNKNVAYLLEHFGRSFAGEGAFSHAVAILRRHRNTFVRDFGLCVRHVGGRCTTNH